MTHPAPTPDPAPDLTPKQRKVLEAMKEHRDRTGLWPTLEELAEALRVSKTTVFDRMRYLIHKGWVHRTPGGGNARCYSIPAHVEVPSPLAEQLERAMKSNGLLTARLEDLTQQLAEKDGRVRSLEERVREQAEAIDQMVLVLTAIAECDCPDDIAEDDIEGQLVWSQKAATEVITAPAGAAGATA